VSQNFWIFVVLSVAVIAVVGAIGLVRLGIRAYTEGAAQGAPQAFTAFASQLLRLTTVVAIIGAVLAIFYTNRDIPSSVAGILSGIAGYVLGGSEKALGFPKNSVANPKP
jgi:hypothetical protein